MSEDFKDLEALLRDTNRRGWHDMTAAANAIATLRAERDAERNLLAVANNDVDELTAACADLDVQLDTLRAERDTAREALSGIANECDPSDPEWFNAAEGRKRIWDITQGACTPAARAVTEWRDIATAPRDGTRVFLTGLNENRGPGRWVTIGGFEPLDGAWHIENTEGDLDMDGSLHPPTGWMPVPLPPAIP